MKNANIFIDVDLRPGRTFIHSAQGHGQSGLFGLALMLKSGVVTTVGEGLERLKKRSNLASVWQPATATVRSGA